MLVPPLFAYRARQDRSEVVSESEYKQADKNLSGADHACKGEKALARQLNLRVRATPSGATSLSVAPS